MEFDTKLRNAAVSLGIELRDLDFIEAVRVGDWNGAWSRREILRHTTFTSALIETPPQFDPNA